MSSEKARSRVTEAPLLDWLTATVLAVLIVGVILVVTHT